MNKKNFCSFDPFMPIKMNNVGSIKADTIDLTSNIENNFEYSDLLINEKRIKIRTPQIKMGYVLLVTKDFIGESNELGEILFDNFISSFTNMMDLPQYIIFLNSAAKAVVSDEKLITYLRKIKKYGVQVIISNESLEYYGLADKNTIGTKEVTADIVEKINLAKKVINL